MDSAYNFRAAYDNGKRLKDAQERWCASPTTQTEPFPDSLEWEVLADVIRGNVKVNIHCYETVDLNDLVRISNEYKFHIAAFHHAHETYLVPDLLKRTYGGNPFVAIFATNARYKKEAWRGSEFAPKILTDAGLDVTMKSDHPVLDSRYLMFEAAQAHHYGLNFSKALSSVTVNSARAVGLDHRLGYVREGYDADLVVWDSFPLNLGATPKQTYIDGIPQLLNPFAVSKPASAQEISKEGVWTEEIQEALDTRGDPDLRPKKSNGNIIFQNVQESFLPDNQIIASSSLVSGRQANTTVVVVEGKIACVGECVEVRKAGLDFDVIDLKGGSIAPGLISVGSGLGLKEIDQEKSTQDGVSDAIFWSLERDR
jgi:imidazolonepropionase-like amidohydrolase